MIGSAYFDAPRTSRGATLVLWLMLLLLPIVSISGPANTTVWDVFNLVFVVFYWARALVRRESIGFPMALPIWLIGLGSCCGLYNAIEPDRALLFLSKELYLYLWFVTAVHFLSRCCSATMVVGTWVSIATTLALLMGIDSHLGLFGGLFGGEVRGAGTFENPNMCGSYLVMAIFLSWSAASAGRRVYYFAIPILFAGILTTASNGALLSLTVGSTVALAISAGRRSLTMASGAGLVLAAIVVAVVGLGHDVLYRSGMDFMSRGRESIGGAALEGAGDRFPIWLDVADSIRSVPTGVGPGNFNRLGGVNSGSAHGAHNEYFGMLAERGPIGLLGWILFLGSGAAALGRLRAAAASGLGELNVDPLCGAIAAVAVHSLTTEFFHFRHLWMFLAFVFAAAGQSYLASRRATVTVRAEPVLAEAA